MTTRALALLLPAGSLCTANAATIYSDTFSGDAGAINGRTPDTVTTAAEIWNSSVTTQFAVDGAGLGILTGTVPNGAGNGAGPSLAFTPDGVSTYTVSIDLVAFGNTNANHWLDLAFVGNDDGSSWFDDGRASMLITPTSQVQTFFGNTGGAFGALANNENFTVASSPATYSMTLNSATGEIVYARNGTTLRTATLSGADILAIGGVTFGAGQGTPVGLQVDNFSVTSVIPEPSSAAMFLGGVAMLFGFRRRHG